VLRTALSELKEIRYALVYGSFASGEESQSSDVDLLIIGDVDEERVLNVVGGIEEEVDRGINYILWSSEEFMERVKSGHHLLRDIASSPVIMVVGQEDEFRRVVTCLAHE
jgi:predicted nucleotidyltransferase